MKKVALMLCFLVHVSCFSQVADPLQNILKTTIEDSVKVNALNNLFLEFEFVDQGKAEDYLTEALKLSLKSGFKRGLAKAYKHLGFFAEDKGNYPEAIKNYFSSSKVYEELGDKRGRAANYNGIGSVYFFQGNYPEALKNYFYGLHLYKACKDLKGIATSYNNLGNVYSVQGQYEEALKNLYASLEIDRQSANRSGVAYSYNNIGNVYENQALQLKREGKPYDEKLNEALKTHLESLKIKEEMNDRPGIASSLGNIGRVYIIKKQNDAARGYFQKALSMAQSTGYKSNLKNSYKSLTAIDSAEGNYKSAYKHYKLYLTYKDSLDNEETRKKTIQSQLTYEFEKKEAVASAEHKKEIENQQAISSEKSRKQRIIIGAVLGGLILVLAFAVFIFRSLRITRKQKSVIEEQKCFLELQKQEVEEQKTIVEEKQKEIIDSITYARRIQQSLLPTAKYIEQTLKRLKK
ncbi:MAG: tetratricopeptide repeat protein [Bacteroidetes bacterium]|nr:tetratricopeptide repeat protein [Bacteroidota bacterium]